MIPFEVPNSFLLKIISGEYVRYGGIVKEAATGQIVGHLKEVGSIAGQLSSLPITPAHALSQAGQHVQLAQIQSTLDGLQLVSSVGAVASVASLGVSIVGFVAVNNKLKQINSRLDLVMGELSEINKIVSRTELKLEALSYSRLLSAINELQIAENANNNKDRIRLAYSASEKFRELKHNYLLLLNDSGYNAWLDAEFPVNEAVDLHSRCITAIEGETYASFLIGDLGAYRKGLEINIGLANSAHLQKKKEAYRIRCDSMFTDTNVLANEVKSGYEISDENVKRIESKITELDFIENNKLTTESYRKTLREMEPEIVLLTTK